MEWISVHDRTPEVNADVLIFDIEQQIIANGYYGRDMGWYQQQEFDSWEFHSVTHWMPLPEIPKRL